MTIRKVNEILNAAGQRDGLENLMLNEQGCAGLQLKDGSSIYFEWLEDRKKLFIYSPLRAPDSVAPELVYRELLRVNCLSGSAFTALHPLRDEVLIQMDIPLQQLSIDVLDNAIEQLIHHHHALSEKIQALH